ncbi:hypothetical protein [Silicimonas sp. MF1-12-2]|uniref:hypothetical protein n=1 Tax=Silicimonas sp. MF1-12-2 TaxID=3384793 RepID=UPI0039B42AFA
MKSISILAIMLLFCGSQSYAKQVDVYRCKLTKTENLISEEMIFIHDAQLNEYLVEDGVIHFVEGGPISAEVKSDSTKKLVLMWSVLLPDSSGKTARLSYRLAYFKGNSQVLVSVQAMGYANQYNGRGTCKKSKANL